MTGYPVEVCQFLSLILQLFILLGKCIVQLLKLFLGLDAMRDIMHDHEYADHICRGYERDKVMLKEALVGTAFPGNKGLVPFQRQLKRFYDFGAGVSACAYFIEGLAYSGSSR